MGLCHEPRSALDGSVGLDQLEIEHGVRRISRRERSGNRGGRTERGTPAEVLDTGRRGDLLDAAVVPVGIELPVIQIREQRLEDALCLQTEHRLLAVRQLDELEIRCALVRLASLAGMFQPGQRRSDFPATPWPARPASAASSCREVPRICAGLACGLLADPVQEENTDLVSGGRLSQSWIGGRSVHRHDCCARLLRSPPDEQAVSALKM